jgi:hypothetical protein
VIHQETIKTPIKLPILDDDSTSEIKEEDKESSSDGSTPRELPIFNNSHTPMGSINSNTNFQQRTPVRKKKSSQKPSDDGVVPSKN